MLSPNALLVFSPILIRYLQFLPLLLAIIFSIGVEDSSCSHTIYNIMYVLGSTDSDT